MVQLELRLEKVSQRRRHSALSTALHVREQTEIIPDLGVGGSPARGYLTS